MASKQIPYKHDMLLQQSSFGNVSSEKTISDKANMNKQNTIEVKKSNGSSHVHREAHREVKYQDNSMSKQAQER